MGQPCAGQRGTAPPPSALASLELRPLTFADSTPITPPRRSRGGPASRNGRSNATGVSARVASATSAEPSLQRRARGHAALAELALDAVAVGEGGHEAGKGVGQSVTPMNGPSRPSRLRGEQLLPPRREEREEPWIPAFAVVTPLALATISEAISRKSNKLNG